MNYQELKNKRSEEINNFPMFFAFSNDQFKKGMESLGYQVTETDKIVKLGHGGYIRKEDKQKYQDLYTAHENEFSELMKNEDFAFSAFDYELANHEYGYTGDYDDTLDSLGLTFKEVENNEMLYRALKKACKKQMDWYAING